MIGCSTGMRRLGLWHGRLAHAVFATTLLLIALSASAAEENAQSYLRDLKTPPRECSQAPFWFWNGDLRPEEIRRQIREMASQGVFASMPHPRFGMDRRDYLEAPYWAAMDAAVDETKKVGGKVLLYDEYNWPSGGAGGRVTEGHPEFYPHGLDYMVKDVEGPGTVRIERPQPGEPESGEFRAILAAALVPQDFPSIDGRASAPFSCEAWGRIGADGASVSGDVPAGKHRIVVFFLARATNPSDLDPGSNAFVDYLNPEATARFIQLTHEAYRKHYSAEFGKTITAIFTDEPQALCAGPFPWTPRFAEEFRKRRGYDLTPHLVALCDERYPQGYKYRAAYWQTVAELFQESYLAPIARWCRENRIAFTGHVYQENIGNWDNAPHLMNWLREMDWPGIDALGPHIQPRDAKTVASVAHLEGKEHFLCEAMGLAGGWNCSLEMLKRGYQFLAVMGVDTVTPHAFFYTVENPRVECPPSFFFDNPYWKYYHVLAGLTDRLCQFNRRGVHQAPVAVYYPIESLWADGTGGRGRGGRVWATRGSGNSSARATIAAFDAVVNDLGAGPWDCDVADASAISRSTITPDAKLRMGAESFACVVLPSVRTIDPKALRQIDAFASAGGTLVIVQRLPERCYPDADPRPILEKWRAAIGDAKDALRAYGKGRIVLLSDARGIKDGLKKAAVAPVLEFPDGQPKQVLLIARRTEEVSSWLLVNEGDARRLSVVLLRSMTPEGSHICAIDPLTGEVRAMEGRSIDRGIAVEVELEQSGSAILTASKAELAPTTRPARLAGERKTIDLKRWTFQLVPDALNNKWTDRVESHQPVSLPVWKMRGRGWERLAGWQNREYDDSQWKTVAAVRDGAVSMDESVLLRATLPPGARAIKLPLPVTGEYTLWVNGALVEKRLGPPGSGTLDISKHVRGQGDIIAIETSSHSGPSGLASPPTVLCGPISTDLRPWRAMGIGWYSGRALYQTTFTNPSTSNATSAQLDLGDVQHYAEVWANGQLAGLALWPPYRLNVTLRPGENRISIVVANSIANRFAWDVWGTRGTGKADPSGLIGPVRLSLPVQP